VEGNLSGSIDAIDSPAVDFSARTLDKEIRVKAIDSRFANAFDRVSDNQREAGRHLDAIFDTGSGRYAELLGGINMLSSEEDGGASYAAALSSLSPGGSQAAAAAQATLAAGRLDGALRCPTYSGEATSRSGESCVWAEAGGADIQQDGLPGYDGTIWGLGTGGQVAFGDNWFAGGAIGYEDSRFEGTDGLTSADGGTGYLAAALGRRFGDFTLSAAVAGSYGSFDTTRSLFLPDFSGTAEGNTDVTTMSARLRAAYTMGTERAYLRPSVDLDVVYAYASGYTESGAGIYDLNVSSQEQTAFIATPAVEIGGSRPLGNDWHLGGFASAGVSFSSEDAWETDATLAASPDGVGTFRTTLPIADVVAKLRAGVSFVNESNDLEVKLEYDGAFGDDYSSHGGLLRLSKRF
jgi:outer membrane autotransporter protein